MQNRIASLNEKFLITFSHVAEHRSFSSAARKLFMTQPAVSQHIKKIESIIGAEVLRRRNGLTLTQHGEVLLNYTEQSKVMRQKLLNDLELLSNKQSFEVAVESSEMCLKLAESYVDKIDSSGDLNISLNCYKSIGEIDLNKYDVVFSYIDFPSTDGQSFLMSSNAYAIACNSESASPSRVIYCNTLDRLEVKRYLDASGFYIADNTRWMSASSIEGLKDSDVFKDSVYVFSKECFRDMNCEVLSIEHKRQVYAWINRDRLGQSNGQYIRALNSIRNSVSSKVSL